MPATPQSKLNRKLRVIYTAECYRKGMGNAAIVTHIKEHFGIGESTARKTMKQALDWLSSYNDCDFIREVRAMQIARSELLLEEAVKERQWRTANCIIDTLNKTLGLYEQKQKIEITSDEIQFRFGGTEEKTVCMGEEGETETQKNI